MQASFKNNNNILHIPKQSTKFSGNNDYAEDIEQKKLSDDIFKNSKKASEQTDKKIKNDFQRANDHDRRPKFRAS